MSPRVLTICIALGLGGCGILDEGLHDVKSRTSETIADFMPTWMGGLPKEAPPRPDDPKYEAWLKAQEQEAVRPKNQKDEATQRGTESPQTPTN